MCPWSWRLDADRQAGWRWGRQAGGGTGVGGEPSRQDPTGRDVASTIYLFVIIIWVCPIPIPAFAFTDIGPSTGLVGSIPFACCWHLFCSLVPHVASLTQALLTLCWLTAAAEAEGVGRLAAQTCPLPVGRRLQRQLLCHQVVLVVGVGGTLVVVAWGRLPDSLQAFPPHPGWQSSAPTYPPRTSRRQGHSVVSVGVDGHDCFI